MAQLMFRDVDAFKCERGRAGIDVVAADAKRGTSVGIQVKSRYYSNATGFPIKEPNADFVVFTRLNLDSNAANHGKQAPECFVFPAAVVRRVTEVGPSGQWPKCHLRKIRNVERYKEAWALIANALKRRRAAPTVRGRTKKRSRLRCCIGTTLLAPVLKAPDRRLPARDLPVASRNYRRETHTGASEIWHNFGTVAGSNCRAMARRRTSNYLSFLVSRGAA